MLGGVRGQLVKQEDGFDEEDQSEDGCRGIFGGGTEGGGEGR
jgi:hypothetical protein